MSSRTFSSIVLLFSASALAGCDQRVSAVEANEPIVSTSFPDNPAACPAELTSDLGEGKPCSLPAGTTCVYHVTLPPPYDGAASQQGFEAFSCGCVTAGTWSEYGVTSPEQCPDDPPQDGAACDHVAMQSALCSYYPDVSSYCTPSDTWKTGSAVPAWECAAP
jgi:hypothetical protein